MYIVSNWRLKSLRGEDLWWDVGMGHFFLREFGNFAFKLRVLVCDSCIFGIRETAIYRIREQNPSYFLQSSTMSSMHIFVSMSQAKSKKCLHQALQVNHIVFILADVEFPWMYLSDLIHLVFTDFFFLDLLKLYEFLINT